METHSVDPVVIPTGRPPLHPQTRAPVVNDENESPPDTSNAHERHWNNVSLQYRGAVDVCCSVGCNVVRAHTLSVCSRTVR